MKRVWAVILAGYETAKDCYCVLQKYRIRSAEFVNKLESSKITRVLNTSKTLIILIVIRKIMLNSDCGYDHAMI